MSRFPAFLDTCVLFGASLNDTVLRIAEQGAFRPHWSAEVLEELRRNLLALPTVSDRGANRRLQAMQDAFPEASVDGYGPLVSSMTCHPKDRHVLAAAVYSGCQVLVTFNTSDFPESCVADHSVAVVHPDAFLLDQLDLYPGAVGRALLRQVREAARPHLTLDLLMGQLARSGVPRFAAEVLRHELASIGELDD